MHIEVGACNSCIGGIFATIINALLVKFGEVTDCKHFLELTNSLGRYGVCSIAFHTFLQLVLKVSKLESFFKS